MEQIQLTDKIFTQCKGMNNLIGYFRCKVSGWLTLDGILVFQKNGVLEFRTPAKKLKSGQLVPYYQIRDREAQKQILDSIKEEIQKVEQERFKNVAKEN